MFRWEQLLRRGGLCEGAASGSGTPDQGANKGDVQSLKWDPSDTPEGALEAGARVMGEESEGNVSKWKLGEESVGNVGKANAGAAGLPISDRVAVACIAEYKAVLSLTVAALTLSTLESLTQSIPS